MHDLVAPFSLLRGAEHLNLVYLKNPKSGCSSISEWLEIASGGSKKDSGAKYHNIGLASYDGHLENLPWITNSIIFTTVRHPFDRLVSGYTDKIGRKQDSFIRKKFCLRYGLDYEDDISFATFLELISSDPFSHELDPHWRPQSANIVFPYIVPNFVCRLESNSEDFSTFLSAIGRRNLGLPGHMHKLSSGGKERVDRVWKYLGDPKLSKMAYELYWQDFENFSYRSETSGNLQPGFVPRFSAHDHPRVGLLAEISDLKDERSVEHLRSEFRCALRDGVFKGSVQSVENSLSQRGSQLSSTRSQIEATGLHEHATLFGELDAKLRCAESALLSSLCKSYRGALRVSEQARKEAERAAQHVAELQHQNNELRRESKVKRPKLSIWLDRVDYQIHRTLSKISFLGGRFQNRFSLSADKRHRREYGPQR